MNETSKTRKLWGTLEHTILAGKGIDIGCGNDPVTSTARTFDVKDGDANKISSYIDEEFDFVYASHCLEHMRDPQQALLDWWKLVRVGGHLFFIVPDEDLYEQGVFPSRFNDDHKYTFTISKANSWSSVSVNVLDIAQSLPHSKIVNLMLQNQGYDYSIYRHQLLKSNRFARSLFKKCIKLRKKGVYLPSIERFLANFTSIDQTRYCDAVAQIQCIVKKIA
ncbi:MAG: methyltransferase domain-containing protein [Pseudomonadota bacterium]